MRVPTVTYILTAIVVGCPTANERYDALVRARRWAVAAATAPGYRHDTWHDLSRQLRGAQLATGYFDRDVPLTIPA